MRKLWLVALYEYKRHVFKGSFVAAVLSMPAIIILSVGVGWLNNTLQKESAAVAVGYVDHTGLLSEPIPAPQRGSSPESPVIPELVPLIPYEDEQEARHALESGEIQVYYVVGADYFETKRVEQVYIQPPAADAACQFRDFLQINRLTDVTPELAQRAVSGSNLIVRWPEDDPYGGREFSQRAFLNSFVPLFIGAAFVVLLLSSSGYLMATVVEEKESRTMELLATSASHAGIMGGKILSVVAISLTQLMAWIAFAGLALLIGRSYLGIELLENLSLDSRIVLPMLAVFIPAYVMVAALMTAVGASVAAAQEAQQVTALFVIPIMLPVWFIQPIMENTNGLLAIGLTLFPVTAMSTLSVRVGFSLVPPWQIAASVTILILCACAALWLAGRALRLGMLRYGQPLHLRELFVRR